jgi:hypothetical protein
MPPVGERRLTGLTTPSGGTVQYEYEVRWLSTTVWRLFLVQRTTGGPSITSGTWDLEYAFTQSAGYSGRTTIDTPSARLLFDYGPIGVPEGELLIEGAIGLVHSEVQPRLGGPPLESEDRTYQQVPAITRSDGTHFDGPELRQRTITRAGRTYVSRFTFDTAIFGVYHHPRFIEETGELTRTIALTYAHPRSSSPWT